MDRKHHPDCHNSPQFHPSFEAGPAHRVHSPPCKSLYFKLTKGCFIRGSFKADTFLAIKGVEAKYKPKPHEHKTLRNIAQVGGYQ